MNLQMGQVVLSTNPDRRLRFSIPPVSNFIPANMPTKRYLDGSTGNYLCRCVHCDGQFIGHKRDCTCPDCVVPTPPDPDTFSDGGGI